MKNFIIVLMLCFSVCACTQKTGELDKELRSKYSIDYRAGDKTLRIAYKKRQSDLQVAGVGKVIKVLPDDLEGSRHQKFLMKLSSGQKLLLAHNIDLAPRVKNLSEGDTIKFYGEYEWNAKGGVIHWTHHDPKGYHKDGWLMHEGKVYQ